MSSSEQWIIAVTAGKWQCAGINEARSAGFKVLAIDENFNAEGFKFSDNHLAKSFSNFEDIVHDINYFNYNICGAVSFCSDAGMFLAAKLREYYSLTGPRVELVRRLLNKAVQREIWSNAGIPVPRWEVYQSEEDIICAAKNFTLPFIIKPADSSGSRGVKKIESRDEDISAAVRQAFECSISKSVLLESFMEGVEFTVETFAENGEIFVLAVTEKKKILATKGTVAFELATPDRPAKLIKQISDTVVEAYKALGYIHGPGHAEIILMQNGQLGMVEVAGRGGGFMVAEGLVPAVSGVNICKLTALQAAGCRIEMPIKKEKSAVLRFFPSKRGTLKSIRGFSNANRIEGVTAAPLVQIGERFGNAEVDGDRLGFILCSSSSITHAQELANKVESMISFEFEEV